MSDLISRSALIEALRKDKESVYSHVFCHTECQFEDDLAYDLEQMINNQPTIEAVPVVHAEWIEVYDENYKTWYYDCSKCGDGFATKEKCQSLPNFCSECGVDMRKGGAE